MTPERAAGAHELAGRWAKANQFAEAAELLRDDATDTTDLADAFVTLAIHAGIAAADVICIAKLGRYAPTGSHDESIRTLKQADPDAAKHLSRLLSIKTKAGYTYHPVSRDEIATAIRAYRALLEIASAAR